jgi:hypothetical protein
MQQQPTFEGAPAALPVAILALQDPHIIAAAIDALIERLDALAGDPDAEPVGDEEDTAWPEYHLLGRHKLESGFPALPHEDAEDDDPAGVYDEGEPNYAPPARGYGAGCVIADPDSCLARDDLVQSDGDGGPGDAVDADWGTVAGGGSGEDDFLGRAPAEGKA